MAHPPVTRLADWLHSRRRRYFVGRAAELELFRRWLLDAESPVIVLHVYGPGSAAKCGEPATRSLIAIACHLKKSIESITAWLWRRARYGGESAPGADA